MIVKRILTIDANASTKLAKTNIPPFLLRYPRHPEAVL
jgi:hypothetical protein